jgi:hypothetical protein
VEVSVEVGAVVTSVSVTVGIGQSETLWLPHEPDGQSPPWTEEVREVVPEPLPPTTVELTSHLLLALLQ